MPMNDENTPMRLIHLVSLGAVGGIQRDYSQFINALVPEMPIAHHTVLTRPGIAPVIEPAILAGSSSVRHLRHVGRFRIPGAFMNLRLKSIFDEIAPDAVVLWSNPRAIEGLRVPAHVPVIYYEHGASWFNRDVDSIRASFRRIDGVVCNSFASSRMVALKWGVTDGGKIRVCPNAVQTSAQVSGANRVLPDGRPIVLGVAGRLEPIKGFALAIHAVARLAARGVDARLLVAGDGPERDVLKDLVTALSLHDRVTFLGFVDDMTTFYSGIDLFLCPSIREPFGLVSAEAMAHGVPVLCTQVDGLPEVVEHEVSGLCLAPTLPVERYPEFGGRLHSMPNHVYDPRSDQIASPKLLSPDVIADAVYSLIRSPERYAAMSRGALARVEERFEYTSHVRQVLAAIQSFCH